jgi:hypothetical protein
VYLNFFGQTRIHRQFIEVENKKKKIIQFFSKTERFYPNILPRLLCNSKLDFMRVEVRNDTWLSRYFTYGSEEFKSTFEVRDGSEVRELKTSSPVLKSAQR